MYPVVGVGVVFGVVLVGVVLVSELQNVKKIEKFKNAFTCKINNFEGNYSCNFRVSFMTS